MEKLDKVFVELPQTHNLEKVDDLNALERSIVFIVENWYRNDSFTEDQMIIMLREYISAVANSTIPRLDFKICECLKGIDRYISAIATHYGCKGLFGNSFNTHTLSLVLDQIIPRLVAYVVTSNTRLFDDKKNDTRQLQIDRLTIIFIQPATKYTLRSVYKDHPGMNVGTSLEPSGQSIYKALMDKYSTGSLLEISSRRKIAEYLQQLSQDHLGLSEGAVIDLFVSSNIIQVESDSIKTDHTMDTNLDFKFFVEVLLTLGTGAIVTQDTFDRFATIASRVEFKLRVCHEFCSDHQS